MSFAPYLGFNGNAREAMTRYAEIFGASDLMMMTFAEAPPEQRPPAMDDKVMHAQFSAGAGTLMGSDTPPGMEGAMSSPSVYHAAESIDKAKKIFDALSEGGTVTMPMAPTFWAPIFGMVTDRWNTSWMITTDAAAA